MSLNECLRKNSKTINIGLLLSHPISKKGTNLSRHLSFVSVACRISVFFHGLNLIDPGIFWQLNFIINNQICNIF